MRGARLEVSTFGEALITLDPVCTGALRHVDTFHKRVGGAELNVAVALARLGHSVSWAGSLGDDEFGAEILAFMRGEGVEVSGATLDPDPTASTGVYFKEHRALGALRVHYYRSGSAASRVRLEDIDVESLLSAKILHLTGITPALSESCREATLRIAEAAVERGVRLSFDANLRFRLLHNRDPQEVLSPLIELADFLFLSEAEAEILLGGRDLESVRRVQASLRAETVVVHEKRGAFAVEKDGVTEVSGFPVEEIDPVGAGDAFVAGFLSGTLRDLPIPERLRLANACGACAVTAHGDAESMPFNEDVAVLVDNWNVAER